MDHQMGQFYSYPPPPPPPSDLMESLMHNYGSSIFFKRLGATVVDFLFLIGLGITLLLIPSSFFGIAIVVYLLLILLYYVLLEGLTGYTVGKLLFRIRAVREDGKAPGFVKGFIRASIRIVDTNPFLMGALPAGICVLVTRKKQRLGDMAANTYVLHVRDVLPAGKKFPFGLTLAAATAIAVSIALAVTGIAIASKTPGSIIGPSPQETFLSMDGEFQVTADDSWSVLDLHNDEADLQIGNLYAGRFLIVISELKSDIGADFTLDNYSAMVEERFARGEALPVLSNSIDIGGYEANQFKYAKVVSDYDLTYLVTIIETDEHFHQLLAWTHTKEFREAEQDLLDVTASFKPAASE